MPAPTPPATTAGCDPHEPPDPARTHSPTRAAATDEAIEILRTLWREPVADYHGRFHRLDGANMEPRPPGGGPPIWVGGRSSAAIRRAARYGDGWLPSFLDPDGLHSGAAALRELTQGRRCPTVATFVYLRIARSDEPAAVRSTTPWMPRAFAGNPDAVAERIDEYRRAGLEYGDGRMGRAPGRVLRVALLRDGRLDGGLSGRAEKPQRGRPSTPRRTAAHVDAEALSRELCRQGALTGG